jgi:hypothetical protein
MPNPTPTAASGPPRPIDSKAAAQAVITELAEVMDGLESVLVEETALVRAGQLRKATGLEPRKAELCGRYFKAAERLKANGKLLSRFVPQDVGALTQRHGRLQSALKSNLMVLATAHAVSEGIVRRLSGDLARKTCPQVYGASGRTMGPDPRRASPLAFSRTL